MDITQILSNYLPSGVMISIILTGIFSLLPSVVKHSPAWYVRWFPAIQKIIIALVAGMFTIGKQNLIHASGDAIADGIVSWTFSIAFYEVAGKHLVKAYFTKKKKGE